MFVLQGVPKHPRSDRERLRDEGVYWRRQRFDVVLNGDSRGVQKGRATKSTTTALTNKKKKMSSV